MKSTRRLFVVLPILAVIALLAGCGERNPADLPAAVGNSDPLVFDDAWGADVYFQAFAQTHVTAVSTDSVYAYGGGYALDGARSLKVNVPPEGSSLGLFTGGVVTSAGARDLADYNALTFYARANQDLVVDVFGFNDNTGTSKYEAGRGNVAIGRDWSFVIVPIPDASKLRSERGLFTIAEGIDPALPDGYDIWVDEIRYAKLGNIEIYRAIMASANVSSFIGASLPISGTRTIFQIDGGFVPVDHMPGYFDYVSSEPSVARLADNTIHLVGTGSSIVTAKLGDLDVAGTVTVTGYEPPTGPAPTPTLPATDVISLFSGPYVDMPVVSWRANWGGSTTQYSEYDIDGDTAKLYSSLNFVGIDFADFPIDAAAMTHLHLDVYAPAGTNFKVKLVSFPASGGAETPDLILDGATTPAFTAGGWSSLDLPLADFTLPAGDWDWGAIGQLVLSTNDSRLVLVDNIYFHK